MIKTINFTDVNPVSNKETLIIKKEIKILRYIGIKNTPIIKDIRLGQKARIEPGLGERLP